MGGVRIWRQDFSEEKPDGESDRDVWDAKCYASFSVVGMWVKAYVKYRGFAGDRRFVLFLFSRAHPRAGDFVLVRAADYAALVEKERGFDRIEAELKRRACSTCGGFDGPYPDCPDPACGL